MHIYDVMISLYDLDLTILLALLAMRIRISDINKKRYKQANLPPGGNDREKD